MDGNVESCIENGHGRTFCENTCKNVTPNSIADGDSLELLKCLPNDSIDLIVTSPPYADRRKQTYGGLPADDYNEWILPITDELQRVLKPDGSFFLNIKDVVIKGERHPYVYDLVLNLREHGWKWIDTFVWHKKNPFPGKRTRRLKDGFEYVYHFAKTLDYKFFPDEVRKPVTEMTLERIGRLKKRDQFRDEAKTGSGLGFTFKNLENIKTALPSNVVHLSTESHNKHHSAVYPERLPDFFVKVASEKGDLVLDPFSGSGTTSVVAKKNCRDYIGFEKIPNYAELSRERIRNTLSKCNVLDM